MSAVIDATEPPTVDMAVELRGGEGAVPEELLPVELDVREVEPDRLRAPQAGRVHELDEGAVPQGERPVAVERIKGGLDLRRLRRVRQAARPTWREGGIRNLGRAEREAQE